MSSRRDCFVNCLRVCGFVVFVEERQKYSPSNSLLCGKAKKRNEKENTCDGGSGAFVLCSSLCKTRFHKNVRQIERDDLCCR